MATDAPTEAPTDAPTFCVPQSCGTEISACYADSTCSAEYEADNDDGDDFPSEAEFKAEIENAGPKFASFLQCVWDNCADCNEAGDCEYNYYGSNALPANKGTMVMAPYSGGGAVGEAEATGGDDTGYGGDDTGEAKVTVVEHDHDGDGVADHMGKEGKASKDAKVAKAKKAAKAAKVAKVKDIHSAKSVKAAHDHAAEVAAPMKFTALATTVADNKMAFTSVASVGVLAVAAAIFVRRRRSGYNAIEADEELETDEASNLLV